MSIDEYQIQFSERLRELRKEKGYKQAYLAEKLDISTTVMSRLENGHSKPKFEVLIAIAEHFDVSVDYLLGRTEKKKVSKIRSTSTETKDVVRGEFTTKNKLFNWDELGKPFNNNS